VRGAPLWHGFRVQATAANDLNPAGKRGLSMTMVRRLRERFHIPADLLITPLRSSEIAA